MSKIPPGHTLTFLREENIRDESRRDTVDTRCVRHGFLEGPKTLIENHRNPDTAQKALDLHLDRRSDRSRPDFQIQSPM